MSNPGPASTTTNHPSQLSTNQAIRLLASYQGVNVNATGDTVLPILNTGSYSVSNVIFTNASTSLTTAELAYLLPLQPVELQLLLMRLYQH